MKGSYHRELVFGDKSKSQPESSIVLRSWCTAELLDMPRREHVTPATEPPTQLHGDVAIERPAAVTHPRRWSPRRAP